VEGHAVGLKACSPLKPRPLGPLADDGQHLGAPLGRQGLQSMCERMRQKWSMPSSMAWVMKGCMG
jgi:hypothetical protein